MPEALGDLAAGLALLVGGAAIWLRGRRGTANPLMVIAGVTWFAGDISSALLYAHRGPLVHVLLSYPSGRVQSRTTTVVIAAAYVDGFVPRLAQSPWVTIALMTATVSVAAWRLRSPNERRAHRVALAGAVAVGGALTLAAVARLVDADAVSAAVWTYDIVVAFTAIGLAAGVLRGRRSVTGLVVDLGDRHEARALRAALAHTLGDPGLQVAYRIAGVDTWVDEAGRPLRLPSDGAEHAVTFVHDQGHRVAAIVHDPAVLDDSQLVASATAAARLAVANVRLQAENAASVRDVASSRRRLIEAADDERERLGDQLRTGAEQRVAAIGDRLAVLAPANGGATAVAVRALVTGLDAACIDLRRFSQGIHPRALTESGLGPALTELAAQSAIPVTLDVSARRFPPTHEVAVFFVCSEALANVTKYAAASRVDIDVWATATTLVVRVADDGGGGADFTRGSGLRGLADRVEALGGALRIDSPPGAGTHLRAELPIATEPAP